MEEENTTVDFSAVQRDYWRQVRESEGFDVENVYVPINVTITGLLAVDCQRNFYPFKMLMKQYASLGLHRYNMLNGTSFELHSLIKFNMLQNCVSSYYMTLVARDRDSPASGTFQVRIDEQKYGTLDLACSIARLKDEVVATKKPFVPHFHGGAAAKGIFEGELPDWPSDDAFNGSKRFHVLTRSEWEARDWIFMYLELVICASDRSIPDLQWRDNPFGDLKILKVAIETAPEDGELPDERLVAKSAIVYITFKGLAEVNVARWKFENGKHVERKAMVRRVIDERTGYLTLVGMLCGGQYVPVRRVQEEKRRRVA